MKLSWRKGSQIGNNSSYQNYELAMPKEDSDNEDVVSADGDQSDEIKENSVDDNDLGRNLSLFDQRRLAERIDPEKGVKAQEFAKLVKTDDLNLEESNHEKKEECLEDEFAIIGYWKQSQNVFSCYHFFYVPTPICVQPK